MLLPWVLAIEMLVVAVNAQEAATTNRSLQEFSFRLSLHWSLDYYWNGDWCVECEFHSRSAGSTCREGDRLVIDKCGSGPRQRFLVDGKRISPQGSPNLCLTRSHGSDGDIRLITCNDNGSHQIWHGLENNSEFQLYHGENGEDSNGESLQKCAPLSSPALAHFTHTSPRMQITALPSTLSTLKRIQNYLLWIVDVLVTFTRVSGSFHLSRER
jgi:hypothetical protein